MRVMGMKDGVLTTPAHHPSRSTAGPSEHREWDGETRTMREGGPSSTGMHITPVWDKLRPRSLSGPRDSQKLSHVKRRSLC